MYPSENKAARTGARIAALGGALWCGLIAVHSPGWAQSLFLLAPMVALPLTLPLAGLPTRAVFVFAGAALLLVPAFVLERGDAAALLTAPWLLVCGGLAVVECARWRRRRDPARVCMAAYLAVGAGWLLLARLGARPLGFADVIVQATAVHFHYAGFVLPVVVRRLANADGRLMTHRSLWGILLGTPLVAAGITLTVWSHHGLEAAATLFLASACWLAAWQQWSFARCGGMNGARRLWMLSSLSLAVAMLLAVGYALGQLTGTVWLDIPFMLRFHGCLQAFGFALPALAAWHLLERHASAIVGQDAAPVRQERTGAESCPA